MYRKIIVSILVFFSFFYLKTHSYLSENNQEKLELVLNYLHTDLENRDLYFYKELNDKFENISKNKDLSLQEKYFFWSILQNIKKIKLENYIIVNPYENKEEFFNHLDFKKDFIEKYWNEVIWEKISEKCLLYFDEIDEVARKNNFPTALIIATWRIESSCNLRNPDNWDWPFQILSHYYEPWFITLEEFLDSVQKFIDFSKHKWNSYSRNSSAKFHFWKDEIDINYDNFTLLDLKIHSAIYNWLRSSRLHDATYINWNLNPSLSRVKDWIVTLVIKVFQYEINR